MTIAELEAWRVPPSLQAHLKSTFTTEEALVEWLHEPSIYLGGIIPADALQAGDFRLVEAALEALDSGIAI